MPVEEGQETSPQPARGWPRGITAFEERRGNAITRVVTAVVAIPIVILAIWLGGWAFALFVALISVGALVEFYWLCEARGARPQFVTGIVATLLLDLAMLHGIVDRFVARAILPGPFAESGAFEHLVQFWLVIAILVLATVAALAGQMFRRPGGSATLDITATIAGVGYVGLLLSTLIALRQSFASIDSIHPSVAGHYDALAMYLVIAVITSIWVCDSAAYYAGRSLGRHKLFERVSPKKTWEGSVAGVIAAVVALILWRQFALSEILTVGDAIVIGLIVGVAGQIGDLAESHLKRDAGIKDSSALIPGHGGLLDRFDSLLFVAPLTWLYLSLRFMLT